VADEDNNAEGRSDEGDGERPYRPPDPYRPGPEDRLWLVLLVLIVVVLALAGLLSNGDPGPANQDGYTGWH
jgi:hypothetical protein